MLFIAHTPFLLTQQALASHDIFTTGDVFAPAGDGKIDWFHPDGTLNQELEGLAGTISLGMAFDSAGRLYVTDYVFDGGDSIKVFDTDGTLIGDFASDLSGAVSIVFDSAGNAYVAQDSGTGDVLKFDSTGNLVDSFDVAFSNGVSNIDLAADQCTMYYSDDFTIRRYDVCTDTQLSDFSGFGDYSLRILPNGEMLAVNGYIHRLDSSGNLIMTYSTPDDQQCFFAASLDPDGTSFWAYAFDGGSIYKIDLGSGEVLDTAATGFPTNGVPCDTVFGGIAIFGELRAATPLYSLYLLEGSLPSDLVVDLNQEVESVAETSNLGVESATFRWINPLGDTVRTEIVPLSLAGQKAIARDTFMPDELGRWTVETDFGNGKVIQKTLDISFNVIPESPIGIILLVGSSIAALSVYLKFRY